MTKIMKEGKKKGRITANMIRPYLNIKGRKTYLPEYS